MQLLTVKMKKSSISRKANGGFFNMEGFSLRYSLTNQLILILDTFFPRTTI